MPDQATTEIELSPPLAESPHSNGASAAEAVQPMEAWIPVVDQAAVMRVQAADTRRDTLAALWARRGIWLGALALLLSYAWTLLLSQDEPVRTRAWVGLIAAGILAILAWGRMPWLQAFARSSFWWPLEKPTPERVLRLTGILLAALLIWQANAQFAAHQFEMFGLAGWLWLASMALLIVSTAGWPLPGTTRTWTLRARRREKPTKVESGTAPSLVEITQSTTPLVAAGQSGLPVRVHRARAEQQEGAQAKWSGWEVALFLGLVAFAVAVRVWDLTNYPYTIYYDEIITGRLASDYVNGSTVSVFRTIWYGIDLPALWFLWVAEAFKVAGGYALSTLRLPAALFGAAAVVPLYFLVRSVWGRAAAISAGAVMAFGIADLHFSRMTLNNIVTPFFWTACFFFLLRALRRGRPVDWVLAGILGGLSEHFYYGTRLLPILLVVFFLYLLVIHWRRARHYIISLGLVVLGYMAAFGPLFAWFMMNPGLYIGRGQGVIQWNHIPTSLDDLIAMWNTLWPLFATNLLTVSSRVASDDLYYTTMLLPFEAALLVLGVALMIWRWRQPASFLLLLSGLGVLFFGGTLIPPAGNVHHWTPAFPAFYAALAVPVSGFAWAIGRFLPRRFQYVAAALLGVGLVVLGGLNLNYYFTQNAATRPEYDVLAAKARFAAQVGSDYRIRSVGKTWQGYDAETVGYLAKDIDGGQVWNPATEIPMIGVLGKGAAFTFFPDQIQYLKPMEALYPGGTHGIVSSKSGYPLMDSYVVPPEVVDRLYGTLLQLYAPGASAPSRVERTTQFGLMPDGVSYPVRARWTALVNLATLGTDNFVVEGASATVLVDGQPMLPSDNRIMQPGWHQVSVEATLDQPTHLRLLLTEGTVQTVEVPREKLWAVQPGSGLLGSVAPADAAYGQLVRNDQFLGYTGLLNGAAFGPQTGGALPFRARWTGEINIPSTGQYQFDVRTDGQSRLTINGTSQGSSKDNSPAKLKVGTCPGQEPFAGMALVQLDAGWHHFQLDYIAPAVGNTLEVSWTPPGSQHSMIPPGAFRFASDDSDSPTAPPALPDDWDCTVP